MSFFLWKQEIPKHSSQPPTIISFSTVGGGKRQCFQLYVSPNSLCSSYISFFSWVCIVFSCAGGTNQRSSDCRAVSFFGRPAFSIITFPSLILCPKNNFPFAITLASSFNFSVLLAMSPQLMEPTGIHKNSPLCAMSSKGH